MPSFETIPELEKFGAVSSEILHLRSSSPATISYLNLIPSIRRPALAGEVWPEAVIQGPFGPIAYVVRQDQFDLAKDVYEAQLRKLHRRLASRADAAMLAVVSPGKLKALPLTIGGTATAITEVTAQSSTRTFFRELAAGALPASLSKKSEWFHSGWSVAETLAALIVGAARRIERTANAEDGLMLVARAMMVRMLMDRGIVPAAVQQDLRNEAAFRTIPAALRSNYWLGDQFFGEMLRFRFWNFNSAFGNPFNISKEDRRNVVETLNEIFVQPDHADARGLTWGNIDFSAVRPIVVAEAFERAIGELGLPIYSRRSRKYTPADFALFLAEESVRSQDNDARTVLVTSPDCGQMATAVLQELVALQWEQRGHAPSRHEIEQIMGSQLLCVPGNDGRDQLAAAMLSLAALDLSAEAFPLGTRFPSPLGKILADPDMRPFDVVIGDHANDRDYGRRALEEASRLTRPHGLIGVCTGNRVLRPKGRRLPTSVAKRLRLVGIVADMPRADRPKPVDIVFARNEPPLPDAEFWLAQPFVHPRPASPTPSWVDAARTQPVSQLLAHQIPGLLFALPQLSVLEAGVLIRLWRKLMTPPESLHLEDSEVLKACNEFISNSPVGQFANTALGGSEKTPIKFPSDGLMLVDTSIRNAVVAIASDSTAPEDVDMTAVLQQICGLDATDLAIIDGYMGNANEKALSAIEFERALAAHLEPFCGALGGDALVLGGQHDQGLHVFAIRSAHNFARDLNWQAISQTLADNPVSGVAIVRLDGDGVFLWINGWRLTAALAWVVALDILRTHADHLNGGRLWESD